MRNAFALVSGMVLAGAVHGDAEAATFTPDMWVYEVTLTATELVLDTTGFIAIATTSNFDDVPAGCIADTIFMDVACTTIPPGLDPLATVDASFAPFLTRTARIGFNSSLVVCDTELIGGCPADGRDSSDAPGFGGPPSYFDVTLDAALGELTFCGLSIASILACYRISPEGVLVSGDQSLSLFTDLVFLNVGTVFGFWDFGAGGTWRASPDSFFLYSGTGRLVSPPSIIPLPAPLLMLGTGLVALGGFAASTKRRKRNSREHRAPGSA